MMATCAACGVDHSLGTAPCRDATIANLQTQLREAQEERDRLDKVIVGAMVPLAEALGVCGMNPKDHDSLAKWVRRLVDERRAANKRGKQACQWLAAYSYGSHAWQARAEAAERGAPKRGAKAKNTLS